MAEHHMHCTCLLCALRRLPAKRRITTVAIWLAVHTLVTEMTVEKLDGAPAPVIQLLRGGLSRQLAAQGVELTEALNISTSDVAECGRAMLRSWGVPADADADKILAEKKRQDAGSN